jgi:hypothetical protein
MKQILFWNIHFVVLVCTGIQFTFRRILPSPELVEYVNTGNKLKDPNRDSGMLTIESGITQFVETVKVSGARRETAVFSYLYASSGLGKTQLAFSLRRRVLYIPLGE